MVESGRHKGRKVKLVSDRIIVGRSEDAQVRVGSTDVSRHHCELLPTAHGVLVNDLDSRNGTLVNGEEITTEFLLAPGNTLSVGPMTFRLLPKSPDDSATPRKDLGLSDDEITDWLSDDVEALQSDTTVIGGPDGADEEPAQPEPWVPPPSKSNFDSIAEEATDIIRRHHEMVAAMEAEERGEEE